MLARRANLPGLLPYEGVDGERFTREGFTLTLRIEAEACSDLSWLGEFTDWPGGQFAFDRRPARRGEYRYFVPAYQNFRSLRRAFSKQGHDRHTAWLRATRARREDWRLAEQLALEGLYCITVIASRCGVELGRSGLGGVDADYVRDAITDHGLVEEAIAEARAVLRRLCDCTALPGGRP